MTSDASLITTDEGWVKVSGSIKFDSVVPIWQQAFAAISQLSDIKVDLKNVTSCDSSALALLTGMFREAKKQKKAIAFYYLPRFLQDLSRVSGLDVVLPLKLPYN